MSVEARLRYPKEQPLFVLGVVFSSVVWLALVVSLVGIFYGLIGLGFTLVAHALFLANIRGNGVRVSARQFPDLFERCKKASRALGMSETPEIYLIQAGGSLNAFATKLLSRKFIVVFSDLADECGDPRQLDFVVGHEIGHLAAGHLAWNAFLWPYMLVPWLGAAYLRAREYTADRCGHFVVGDVEQSMRGLIVLAAGGAHAARADIQAFMEQRRETGGFWSAVLELVSSHPYLCKRVAAIQELHQPGSVVPVPRNPLAYPLAPIFGLAAAGPAGGGVGLLVVVAMIGIIAAIAIPSLLRARVSANEAATLADVRAIVAAEAVYQSTNGGYFESKLDCLTRPKGCVPGFVGVAPLDAALAASVKSGYSRQLHHGRLFAAGEAPEGVSASSTDGFAVVAVPMTLNRTGTRTFCGDASGRVCARIGGSVEGLIEGVAQGPGLRCSAACAPLE